MGNRLTHCLTDRVSAGEYVDMLFYRCCCCCRHVCVHCNNLKAYRINICKLSHHVPNTRIIASLDWLLWMNEWMNEWRLQCKQNRGCKTTITNHEFYKTTSTRSHHSPHLNVLLPPTTPPPLWSRSTVFQLLLLWYSYLHCCCARYLIETLCQEVVTCKAFISCGRSYP